MENTPKRSSTHFSTQFLFGLCIFFLSSVILSSCTTTSPLQSSSKQLPYNWESTYLHPEILCYHLTADSSALYFKLRAEELLYTRKDPAQPFSSEVQFEIMLISADLSYADTLVFNYTDINDEQQQRDLIGRHDIYLPEGKSYFLDITVKDLNRRLSVDASLFANKDDIYSRQNFLITSSSTLAPLFHDNVAPGETVYITSDRYEGSSLEIQHTRHKVALPPPPDSFSKPRYINTLDEPKSTLEESFGTFELTVDSGLHVISVPFTSSSFTLFAWTDSYPAVTTVEDMVRSLRYITSKPEFERITKSNYPKKELDDFWIDIGGSKDRARELIRIYYQRVQEANYYFSSITEGWRTDRGLIHIVFGNPNKIQISPGTEVWIYGEESNLNSLVFRFYRQENPFSDQVYMLERNPAFEPGWERALSAWRNGRIYNE